jgi:hypothetical protein
MGLAHALYAFAALRPLAAVPPEAHWTVELRGRVAVERSRSVRFDLSRMRDAAGAPCR